jgi:hypothetical protein
MSWWPASRPRSASSPWTTSCWGRSASTWSRAALLRRGGGAPEPLRLPSHRQAIRPPAGLPHLRPGRSTPTTSRPGRPIPPDQRPSPEEAGAGRGRHRRRAGRPHPPGPGRSPVPRRGLSQGLGSPAAPGRPHGRRAGPAADAGASPPGPPQGRPCPRAQGP